MGPFPVGSLVFCSVDENIGGVILRYEDNFTIAVIEHPGDEPWYVPVADIELQGCGSATCG